MSVTDFIPLRLLSKDQLKQREHDIQHEIHEIIREHGSSCEAYWNKRLDLNEVQDLLYNRFNTVGEEMTKGARS